MTSDVAHSRALMIMHPQDNVAVCLRPLEAGEEIQVTHNGKNLFLKIVESVPLGHKVSLFPIASGQAVTKYGETIGRATKDILTGQHVHDHNISDY
jgi:altronate dehydratase